LRKVKLQGRDLVWVGRDVELPLMGSIAFGVIDRGTNILQVRPVSFCPLSCIFCSTDAGPKSRWRRSEYLVEEDLIIDWVRLLARMKGKVEAHIDTVGDPLMYGSRLPQLIQDLKSIPEVRVVSMQTHGSTLTESLAADLADAGLDRVNLSLDTLNAEKAKYLQGTKWFDVERVKNVAKYILDNTSTDVMLTPLLLPGINDKDVEEVIVWGRKVGVGKRYPPFGIQIFIHHKHGRRPKGLKRMTRKEFVKLLRFWELKHKVRLILGREDFGVVRRPSPPTLFRRWERVRVKVLAPGWLRNEWIAVPVGRYEGLTTVTVIDEVGEIGEGSRLTVRIISNKHNIYLARPT